MSSSSSKSEATPPSNPEFLQHESTLNIPPDPGNITQNPLTNSTMPSGIDLILNSQSGNQTQIDIVSFRQVLHYLWENNINNNNASTSTPTPPQIWITQNVYPLVTPMRIICYFISQLCFFLAYGFYMKTEHYKTHIHAPLIFFVAANIGNFVFLILLMFFSFLTKVYERYLNHFLFKSIGEVMVMLVMSFVIMGIGHKHQEGNYEVAGLVTCGFLTIYSLCIIILLKPGHHYSLLDATATLTLHLGLVGIYCIPTAVFIFVILVIKNYIWSLNIGHNAQSCTYEDGYNNLSRV
ncbi:hypothetical protein AAHE18_16G038100 [Arachis hypogaea]|nr:uncharacterized protein DS421_16g529180 [Arachis hypogaea]